MTSPKTLVEALTDTLAEHDKGCQEPQCKGHIALIAHFAHVAGLRSDTDDLDLMRIILRTYETECADCNNGLHPRAVSARKTGENSSAKPSPFARIAALFTGKPLAILNSPKTAGEQVAETMDERWVAIQLNRKTMFACVSKPTSISEATEWANSGQEDRGIETPCHTLFIQVNDQRLAGKVADWLLETHDLLGAENDNAVRVVLQSIERAKA
jgi:hypothetical protein